MDKNAVVEIVDRFRRGLEARGIRPQKVILYGSHATGVDTAVSDIDWTPWRLPRTSGTGESPS
jgi:predicted nucleotidyltransferase